MKIIVLRVKYDVIYEVVCVAATSKFAACMEGFCLSVGDIVNFLLKSKVSLGSLLCGANAMREFPLPLGTKYSLHILFRDRPSTTCKFNLQTTEFSLLTNKFSLLTFITTN